MLLMYLHKTMPRRWKEEQEKKSQSLASVYAVSAYSGSLSVSQSLNCCSSSFRVVFLILSPSTPPSGRVCDIQNRSKEEREMEGEVIVIVRSNRSERPTAQAIGSGNKIALSVG